MFCKLWSLEKEPAQHNSNVYTEKENKKTILDIYSNKIPNLFLTILINGQK